VYGAVREAATAAGPVPTRLAGLGAFPNARRARVLWAGLDDADGRLVRLASSLDEALRREFAPEKRAFTPHLTLARFEPPSVLGDLDPAIQLGEPFVVERIVLYRSHLRRPAPRYESLGQFPLEGR
jgi:2'-5' RNA ligase